ncbi:MAG: aminotransferase class V-fold PLP-dependent enzyme [Dehalococcoidia bacterium]
MPVPGRLCDFAVSATYKWFLGCQGVAALAWNRERVADVAPAISGWRSAQDWQGGDDPLSVVEDGAERLEPGNPPWPALSYLGDGARYLVETGIERIAAHVEALAGEVNARLRHMELDVATPSDPRRRAGNTCFWTAEPEARSPCAFFAHGVLVNGYAGRIRIFHPPLQRYGGRRAPLRGVA